MLPVEPPFKLFTDSDGMPLDGGFVYFGKPNQNPVTAPVEVFWDAAGTIPAEQPLRTVNGYIYRSGTPANVFVNEAYSELVRDRRDRQVLYARTSDDFSVNRAFTRFTESIAGAAGSGKVGFGYAESYVTGTIGWAAQTAGSSFNFWRMIPPSEWKDIEGGTSTFDATALLTQAIATYKDVFVPPGVYRVNPDIGVLFVASMRLRGAGQNQTIFAATPSGATLIELVGHVKGSVFKRAYTPGVQNPRLDTVLLSDFAVVLNHPLDRVTSTETQIAVDFRHVGRTVTERVWVGNYAPLGGRMSKTDPGAYVTQGYGFVFGNVDTNAIGYCGGEVGRVINCSAYGLYKNIVIDDEDLSPLSGAHAISVIGCDIQAGHYLLGQEQQYTSGCLWDGNTVQDVRRQPGATAPTHVMRVAGYDNEIRPGYIEAGVADYILRFESASANNVAHLIHYSATTIGLSAFSDAGRRNRIKCRRDSGMFAGGVDSKGAPIVRYDRAYEEFGLICHWDGATVVIDDGFGASVSRPTTAGDYVFTFDLPFISATSYTIEVSTDTNSSSHGALTTIVSRSVANIRLAFFAQNGAVTTPIDPRSISIRIKQL